MQEQLAPMSEMWNSSDRHNSTNVNVAPKLCCEPHGDGSCTEVSAQIVTCNDDDGISCTGAQGSMLFGAPAGVQYWIQVAAPESFTKATALGGQLEFSFESTVPVTDPRLVFSDGFESGNTSAWSTTIP